MATDIVPLLKLLADGEFHSGEDLGRALGVSRTAIWKHLKKIEAMGIKLEARKGLGYQLTGGLELLCADTIGKHLSEDAEQLLGELDLQMVVDSTNRRAMEVAQSSGVNGYVCMAEQQTAGRGRRGRQWVSPFSRNIYLSVLWRFEGGAAALEGLSLAVGVALTRALERVGLDGVQLKWPNDLLWQGRKLGGILLEMTGDAADQCQVVIGVGLNVAMPEQASEEIDQAWVDVKTAAGQMLSRNQIGGCILSELLPMLASFQETGFAPHKPCWERNDAFRGREVELHTLKEVHRGVACGVTDRGALKLLVDQVEREFNGGEVSLRGVS